MHITTSVYTQLGMLLLVRLAPKNAILIIEFAKGAGAASRIHVGTVMFFGMTVATVLGIFLIPGLFVMMQTFLEGVKSMLGMSSGYDDEDEYDEGEEDDEDDKN